MNTETKPMYEWNTINWAKVQRNVFKLQKRIYQASQRGDLKSMRKLQKLLLNSNAARLLAVRRVTQDNRGKNTAGVDGIKRLGAKQRLQLCQQLSLKQKAEPTRRVWIPKPNSSEKRPLGIPVMKDRALQALVKIAIEPEWEARFEPNSYGFRPGRSAHDALEAIFLSIRGVPKFVLDADIEKCFDKINHEELLRRVDTYPSLTRLIRAWLKAGVMENDVFSPTEHGTPQGGVISPLLANIALHGMEYHVAKKFPYKRNDTEYNRKPQLIRYADDLVVLHKDRIVIEQCKEDLGIWLTKIGLSLKPSKTRIAHTLDNIENESRGFEFLGMHVGQYKVGKTHTGKNSKSEPLGRKTLIRPSVKSQKRQHDSVKQIIRENRAISQEALISKLNPKIRGWSQYHSSGVSKQVFTRMNNKLFQSLRRWVKRRHPNKSQTWANRKYWNTRTGHWTFAARNGMKLRLYSDTPIIRHIKVAQTRSPFDGNWNYWATRLGRYPSLPANKAKLLTRQKGKCPICKLLFTMEDRMEIDHIIPKKEGGRDRWDNLQLLHTHCHHDKSAKDMKRKTCSVMVNGRGAV